MNKQDPDDRGAFAEDAPLAGAEPARLILDDDPAAALTRMLISALSAWADDAEEHGDYLGPPN